MRYHIQLNNNKNRPLEVITNYCGSNKTTEFVTHFLAFSKRKKHCQAGPWRGG